MRSIRVADPRDRIQPTPTPRRSSRGKDAVATIPILLLVPALVLALVPAFASSTATGPTATTDTSSADGSSVDNRILRRIKPSPTPAPTATPTPTATATPAPTATPIPTATVPPTVISDSSDYILLSRADLLSRPMSGSGWTTLKAWADKPVGVPNLSDQNDQDDIVALAKAIVFARTGVTSYRTDAIRILQSAVGTEMPGDALGVARNVAPLALAADFVGWHDPAWSAWLGKLRTWANPDRGYTLISNQMKRPNNWGTHAGASRMAVDLYLGDKADLAAAAAVFHGWTGDRSAYAGFTYGELSWQADRSRPLGVNPVGTTVLGMNVDGILPDDMRRGGVAITVGSAGVSYTWEALQGAVLGAKLLSRAGYASWGWGDQAIRRAVARMYAMGYTAVGDDDWQPYLVNAAYRTTFAAPTTTHPGKGFGFADWLFG